MAENNLQEFNDGDVIGASDNNQTVRALKGNIVPRNEQGVATARAGSLGTDEFPFDELHVDEILLGGAALDPAAGGGGTADAALFQNGVVNGQAPTDRPGMCGWLLQAGSGGVRIIASESNPLVVRVGGEEYSQTAPLVGGTPLPEVTATPASPDWELANPSNAVTPGPGESKSWYYGDTVLATAQPFIYGRETGDPEVPTSIGNLLIFKVRGTRISSRDTAPDSEQEYFMCERNPRIAGRAAARRAIRAAFNTSSTGYTAGNVEIAPADAKEEDEFKQVQPGYVFIDPTASPWSILIQPRILGTTAHQLPATATTGDVIFRQSSQRWYNYEGAAWVQKSWVFLGIVAIETVSDAATVVGVAGVRTEASLRKLYTFANLLHAPAGVWDGDRQALYNGEVSGTLITWTPPDVSDVELVEGRSPQAFMSQRNELLRSRYQVDADDLTLQALRLNQPRGRDRVYFAWLDVETEQTFADDAIPAIISLSVGRAFFAHQHRNAILLGTFAQTGLTETPTVPNDTLAVPDRSSIPLPAFWITELAAARTGGEPTIRALRINGGTTTILESSAAPLRFENAIGAPRRIEAVGSGTTVTLTLPTLSDVAAAIDPS